MLTEDQIQFLYKFCVKHYVRYYDMQVELVDHLANAVEEKMAADAKLSFEQALDNVYKGFGVMGFSNVVAERANAERKRYNKRNLQIFKSFFTIPRIAVTILIFLALCIPVVLSNDPETVYLFYCAGAIVYSLVYAFYFYRKFRKPKKDLLVINGGSGLFGTFGLLLQLPNFYFNLFRRLFDVHIFPLHPLNFLIVFICVVLIIAYIAGFETYKTIYNEARENYPLAFQND